MVTIKKGKNVFTVTKGVFENSFRKQGYKIVDEAEIEPKNDFENEGEENDDHDDFNENLDTQGEQDDEDFENESDEDELDESDDEDDLSEKPLAKMNRPELKRYAEQLDVDITGLTTNKEIREAIKDVLYGGLV